MIELCYAKKYEHEVNSEDHDMNGLKYWHELDQDDLTDSWILTCLLHNYELNYGPEIVCAFQFW